MTPAEAAAFLRRYNEWRRTDDMYGMPYPDPREIGEAIDAAIEMIDRLEAAEKGRDALRAKIEQMERQKPVGKFTQHPSNGLWEQDGYGDNPDARPLYALPGAQPAPSEQDASVRKAWARFSHELHRGPDAPYPGMSDAFEQHFSQSFTDREWRAEAATWAAAWKAAKRHGVPPAPSINEGVRKVTLGFRWESEAQHHIPTIKIEFDPVSPESPNDAKGWQDRDRIASMLSPEAKP